MSKTTMKKQDPNASRQWLPRCIALMGFAVLVSASGVSLADDTKGVLPVAATAAICYKVTCYANQGGPEAAMYQFNIKGNTAGRPFNVRMTASKGGVSQSTVARQNGSGIASPTITFKAGPGIYDVKVDKILREGQTSLNGTMDFQITAHCLAPNGAHTGEDIKRLVSCSGPLPPPPPPPTYKSFSSSLPKLATQKSWKLECAATKKGVETSNYKFQIKFASLNKPFNLALKVRKEGFPEQEVVATDSKKKQPSEWGVLEGGNGIYYLDVVKQAGESGTTMADVSFAVKHNCFSENGAATVLKNFTKLP